MAAATTVKHDGYAISAVALDVESILVAVLFSLLSSFSDVLV